MIKGNELRIGNLLKTKSGKTIKTVDAIHGEGTEYYKFKGSREIEFSDTTIKYCCANYLPIELTPKWLVRAGFKKEGNFYIINRFLKLMETNDVVGYAVFWNGTYAGCLCYVKYVHQIQNLFFSLFSEELVFSSTEP